MFRSLFVTTLLIGSSVFAEIKYINQSFIDSDLVYKTSIDLKTLKIHSVNLFKQPTVVEASECGGDSGLTCYRPISYRQVVNVTLVYENPSSNMEDNSYVIETYFDPQAFSAEELLTIKKSNKKAIQLFDVELSEETHLVKKIDYQKSDLSCETSDVNCVDKVISYDAPEDFIKIMVKRKQ